MLRRLRERSEMRRRLAALKERIARLEEHARDAEVAR